MAIADDISVAVNGDIRYTGTTTNYTVLQLRDFLADLSDNAQASGDDLHDITSETAYNRSTDQILTLNDHSASGGPTYNIDDTMAQHLYDGSVTQKGGDEKYSGLVVLGPVESGTEVMVIQDGNVLAPYWGTGINADAATNIATRMILKSRTGGADIDGKRIITRAMELGDQYKEFRVTLGDANSVSALGNGADLNNADTDATIEGWTDITNTEGQRLLDIDGNGTNEEYYSEWNKGAKTINQVYQRSKWIQQRAHVADSNAETGNDFIVDDNAATSLGRGTEFSARPQNEKLREVRFRLKVGTGAPTGDLTAEVYDSDDAGTAAPLPEIQAAIADDNASYTDETTAANNATTNDMTLLPAAPVVDEDGYYFGANARFPYFDLNLSTQGSGTWTITWQYYNGAAWVALPNVSDGTTGFTATTGIKRVSWNVPLDWQTTTVNSQGPFYYVRARLTAFTSLTTQPLGQQVFKPLAVSAPVLSSQIQSGYTDVIFRFDDADLTLTADQEYFCVVRHPNGDGTNYFHVEGDTTTADDGNVAAETAVGSWTGTASQALNFVVKSSPIHHERAGELFRGIDYEVVYNTEAGGPFVEDEVVYWGTQITYDGLTAGPFQVGEYIKIGAVATPTVSKNGGKILADTGTVLTVALDITTGNLVDNDKLTGLSSGATADATAAFTDQNRAGGEGLLLALDDNGADGDLYIQLLSGAAPVNLLPIKGRTSGASCQMNTTINTRTISPEFIGASTGANIVGAYGIGFETTDVGNNDKFTDLSGTLNIPPNNVTITFSGLVSGEDYILIGPRNAGILQKGQMTTDTILNGAAETQVSITGEIPTSGTPSSGAGTDNTRLRVELDTGVYRKVQYDSVNFTTDVFTLNAADVDWTDPNDAASGNNVFIAYIDVLSNASTEAFQAVHTTDQDMIARIRDGGTAGDGIPIKTIETPFTFGSANQTISITRTSDA